MRVIFDFNMTDVQFDHFMIEMLGTKAYSTLSPGQPFQHMYHSAAFIQEVADSVLRALNVRYQKDRGSVLSAEDATEYEIVDSKKDKTARFIQLATKWKEDPAECCRNAGVVQTEKGFAIYAAPYFAQ